MPWVTVEFSARFNSSVAEVPNFVAQITAGTVGDKLPIIKQYVPELDVLVWNATSKKFFGVLTFNTDNYAIAPQDWKNPDGTWNFTPEIEIEVEDENGVVTTQVVPRAAWTVIRMITDRIFCVPAQTRTGPLWSSITARYQLWPDEITVFTDDGGGVGNGGWGGMQKSP